VPRWDRYLINQPLSLVDEKCGHCYHLQQNDKHYFLCEVLPVRKKDK